MAGAFPACSEVDWCCCRCADAINLAVRFGAPIYVNKQIAVTMARSRLEEHNESHSQIVRTCKCVAGLGA